MTLVRLARLAPVAACILALGAGSAHSQQRVMLSIASGATGGVYYPLAGGMAGVLSRQVPGWQATAEVTGGSIDNLKLVGAGRADLALTMADAAWDAYKGQDKFKGKPLAVRTLLVLYPNRMHVATLEGISVNTIADLKGRRVSVGAPGSATELMGLRVLEALGMADSVKRERLSVNESVNALKDRKIDAFLWAGGLPTAAVMDLAATPGTRLRLLDHGGAVEAMNARHGPLYTKGEIPAKVYQGVDKPVSIAVVWNLLIANASMPDDIAYRVVKTLMERKPDLVAVHKEAEHIELPTQAIGASPLPFHPGALRYLAEKGVKAR